MTMMCNHILCLYNNQINMIMTMSNHILCLALDRRCLAKGAAFLDPSVSVESLFPLQLPFET